MKHVSNLEKKRIIIENIRIDRFGIKIEDKLSLITMRLLELTVTCKEIKPRSSEILDSVVAATMA